MRQARLYWLVCCVLTAFAFGAEGDAPDPAKLKTEGYLSDFAHVVDPANRSAIAQYCGGFQRATGVQIALVTLATLGDQPIEDFSSKLFHNWGIGQKDSSEGVMLVLVVNDRKSRIEVGYGLEQYLPDGLVGMVLRGMRPQLQARDYGAALLQAAQAMGAAVAKGKGVELTENPRPVGGSRGFKESMPIPFPLILLGLVLLAWVVSRMVMGSNRAGSRQGYRRGGGGPGVFWGGGGFGGFGGGGSGGGGGNSGGGFGGFGGGDSGGGGASSDW